MFQTAVNAEGLLAATRDLGDIVIDPALWPTMLQRISDAAGATGAALLRSDFRTPDNPRTASADDSCNCYFTTGWHTRDHLAKRGFALFVSGRKVLSDQDLVTAEEMRHSDFYNEILVPFGFQWFAAIGFAAGPSFWAMLILRSALRGPFHRHEKRILATLAARLTETATLSNAVGYAALTSATSALDLVGQPTLALDRLGCVLDLSASTAPLFDNELYIRDRRLMMRDPRAASALSTLVDQLRTTPDTMPLCALPIVVHRTARPPLLIRILPIDGAARTPFLGARALLTFSTIEPKRGPDAKLLADIFRLTRAESEVAALVAQGKSLAAIADGRGIARVTVRNQLKTVLAKTGTHRQAELVALLSRL